MCIIYFINLSLSLMKDCARLYFDMMSLQFYADDLILSMYHILNAYKWRVTFCPLSFMIIVHKLDMH
jgi:hypothetical protein